MFINVKKVFLTFIVLVLTLGLLFGSFFLYTSYFIKKPLSLTLDNSELIAEYTIIHEKKSSLKVKLNKVDDLSHAFQEFLVSSEPVLFEKDLQLELYSNPNSRLIEFYQEINPTFYETVELGNYSKLQEAVKDKNKEYNLTKASVSISGNYIFLQLEDKGQYLYYVENRQETGLPRITTNIGSDIQ